MDTPHRPAEFQCVGSFHATDQDGRLHVIEKWVYFEPVHDRDRARVAPGQIALTTTDGHWVERIAQGKYRLRDNPEVTVSSDDPDAP